MIRSRIRPATTEDLEGIYELQFAAYPALSRLVTWRKRDLGAHLRRFPRGQFVAAMGEKVVGYCANMIVDGRRALHPHTYDEITGGPSLAAHDPNGDTLYGVEIMVDPAARGRGIGTRFYRRRFRLVQALGLHYFVSGGRIPGYAKQRKDLTVQQYVRRVLDGKVRDRTLSVQLKAGLRVGGVLDNYLSDPKSGNHASLLIWENPDWKLRPPPGSGILGLQPRPVGRPRSLARPSTDLGERTGMGTVPRR